MRILFVNSIQMWGGGEVWLMDMMRGLAARGHASEILCRRGTPLEARAREAGWTVHAIRFGGDLDPGPIAQAAALMRRRRYDVVCTNTDKDLARRRHGGAAGRCAGHRAEPRGGLPAQEHLALSVRVQPSRDRDRGEFGSDQADFVAQRAVVACGPRAGDLQGHRRRALRGRRRSGVAARARDSVGGAAGGIRGHDRRSQGRADVARGVRGGAGGRA